VTGPRGRKSIVIRKSGLGGIAHRRKPRLCLPDHLAWGPISLLLHAHTGQQGSEGPSQIQLCPDSKGSRSDVRRAPTVAKLRGTMRAGFKGTRRASEKATRAADMANELRSGVGGRKQSTSRPGRGRGRGRDRESSRQLDSR
jgi:hypothetical protein